MSLPEHPAPKFCGQCGAPLPPDDPRFCIDCGHPVRSRTASPTQHPPVAATGATVRLTNARAEQAVVGGTVRLATSVAVPPGLWFQPEPPGDAHVIAIYAPLRAIVGGWSGTTSDGWQKTGQSAASAGQDLVRFETTREWFAAATGARGMRLRIRIGASSFAEEGRTRRGFTYRVGSDPPMEVLEATWLNSTGRHVGLPIPEIQIMAPPRVRRVSDFDESVREMSAREAETWAKQGQIHGVFRLPDQSQQRTPVGRGLPLPELFGGTALARITGQLFAPFRVQLLRPLIVERGAWQGLQRRMQRDAAALGLDLGTDAVAEWWIDQQGHDGAVFERGSHQFAPTRTVVAFRRNQIAAVTF